MCIYRSISSSRYFSPRYLQLARLCVLACVAGSLTWSGAVRFVFGNIVRRTHSFPSLCVGESTANAALLSTIASRTSHAVFVRVRFTIPLVLSGTRQPSSPTLLRYHRALPFTGVKAHRTHPFPSAPQAPLLRTTFFCSCFGALQIHEGGSFAEVEFTAMGSGSLAALSVLEVCAYP